MVHIHLLEFFHPASYQSTGCGQLIVGKLCLAKVTETSGSPTAQRPRPFTWSCNYSAGSPGLPLVSQRPLLQLPWNSTFLFPNPQSSHFQSAVCQSCFPRKLLHSRVPAWYCKTILRIQSSLQSVFPRESPCFLSQWHLLSTKHLHLPIPNMFAWVFFNFFTSFIS